MKAETQPESSPSTSGAPKPTESKSIDVAESLLQVNPDETKETPNSSQATNDAPVLTAQQARRHLGLNDTAKSTSNDSEKDEPSDNKAGEEQKDSIESASSGSTEAEPRDGPLHPGEMTPPPVRASLGKPRLLATSKIVLPQSNTPAAAAAGATPSPSELSEIEDELDLINLLQFAKPQSLLRESKAALTLRASLHKPGVLRKMFHLIGRPRDAVLLKNLGNVSAAQRDQIIKKLTYIASEVVLQKQNSNQLFKQILSSGALDELWMLAEDTAPIDNLRAAYLKLIVDRMLWRAREHMLMYLGSPSSAVVNRRNKKNNLTPRAEAIRSMPVFRLFRHLENDHISYVLTMALDKEVPPPGEGGKAPNGAAKERAKSVRWSNKFDLVRVLVHKMKIPAEAKGPVRDLAERTSANASAMLCTILKHSSTHVDLLKNVMQNMDAIFGITLGLSVAFDRHVFVGGMTVLMDLCRTLSRIWLPHRQTRIINDSLNVFMKHIKNLNKVFDEQKPARGGVGMVRHKIAEMVSLIISGRLVSKFSDELHQSGLMKSILDAVWQSPNSSMFHHTVFAAGILPLIQNTKSTDTAFSAGSEMLKLILDDLQLWKRIRESYYSYDEQTDQLRCRYSFNGFLTQITNALVATEAYDMGRDGIEFLGTQLDWVNTLETTPLAVGVFTQKMQEEGKLTRSSDDRPSTPTKDANGRSMRPRRVGHLSKHPPKCTYESPPRPRVDASQQGDIVSEEQEFNLNNFWKIPMAQIDFEDDEEDEGEQQEVVTEKKKYVERKATGQLENFVAIPATSDNNEMQELPLDQEDIAIQYGSFDYWSLPMSDALEEEEEDW